MTNLYETDFQGWIEDQVNLLKTQQWQLSQLYLSKLKYPIDSEQWIF